MKKTPCGGVKRVNEEDRNLTEPAEAEDNVFGTFTRERGCLAGMFIVPFVIAIGVLLPDGQNYVIIVTIASFGAMPFVFAPLRRRAWFWIVLVLLFALHVAAIISVDWEPIQRSGSQIKLIFFLDLFVMIFVVWLVSLVMRRK